MTGHLKQLRHDIYSICENWIEIWSGQRDSSSDIGATIEAEDEYVRTTLPDIVAANLARANQALRSLEEYSKAVCPEISRHLESTRYRFYDIEKSVHRFLVIGRSITNKSVYVLTSGCKSQDEFENRIRNLGKSGADFIQLRDKDLDDSELLARAKAAVRICLDFDTLFIVNDRPDIALMSEADGVHVGQEEFPVNEIRKMFRYEMIVGVSTHSIEQARKAECDGADYIGVGPTFRSHTKCFDEFTGPALLEQVAAEISVPAFAIGGINLENIQQVADSGFTRVAVSNVVHRAESAEEVIKKLKAVLATSSTNKQQS